MESTKIELIVKVTMKEDTQERSLAATLALAAASREEEACERFRVLRHEAAPLDLYLVEAWTTAAQRDEHKSAAHTQEFLGAYGELFDGAPVFLVCDELA